MSAKSEYRFDREKNRLYIKLSGFFRGKDAPEAIAGLKSALEEVRPGFDVVTDLSEFMPGSPAATEALSKGGALVAERGRRNGVRVTGGLMTGLMQFQRMLKGFFEESNTRYAKSVAEADEILDNWAQEP